MYPPNGTIDLMYFPYYGKKVQVSLRACWEIQGFCSTVMPFWGSRVLASPASVWGKSPIKLLHFSW